MSKAWGWVAKELFFIRFGVDVPPGDGTVSAFLKSLSELPPDSSGRTFDKIFEQDMKTCLKKLVTKDVTSATINNLFNKDSPQREIGKKTLAFILKYVAEMTGKDNTNLQVSGRRKNLIERLNSLYDSSNGKANNAKKRHDSNLEKDFFYSKSTLFQIIERNVTESSEEQAIFANNIFRNKQFNDLYDNAAYFSVFRQSTLPDRIIKSFLAILTPAENRLGFFSYLHFVRGSSEINQITKVSRGVISHTAPATYFIGTTKRTDYNIASNYEIISFERDTFIASSPLLYGLTMAAAAVNQPVVSRIVFLRIGDRRSLKRKLTHDDVNPTEFRSDQITHYLSRDLENIPDGFQHIDRALLNVEGVASLIKDGIQNEARADIMHQEGKEKKSPPCRGALDTWGFGPRA